MSLPDYTRIHIYMPDPETQAYTHRSFDIATSILHVAYNSFIGGTLPHPEHYKTMVLTDKPFGPAALPPCSLPFVGFMHHPRMGDMLRQLEKAGVLLPPQDDRNGPIKPDTARTGLAITLNPG